MILVTGAGGKTGQALVKALSKESSVIALVYREELVPVLKAFGAKGVLVGDMRDSSVIRSAMQGVQSVYHTCPNMQPDELEMGRLIVDEAKQAGVKHIVYHSVLHPQTEKMKHHWQKMRVEEMIFESGISFTVLQPAPYMQNLLAGWKTVLEEGCLRVPYSVNTGFSFIDLEDLSEAANVVLTEPGHTNAVYELAGTAPVSHVEVANSMSRILHVDVRAEREEIRDWKDRAKGISEYALENLVRMFEYYDRWGLGGSPNVLKWLLRREPTWLDTFFKRLLRNLDATH